MPSTLGDHDTTISHMVKHAQRLYDRFGPDLDADPEIHRLVETYSGAIARSGARMLNLGVVETCTDCATQGPGSCCFPGIESGYDAILLLINRLMGCRLPDAREVEASCYFVGSKGCKLKGRYYFCLQYLCPRLENLLGPARANNLLSTIGEELAAGWRLEQALRRRIGSALEDAP